ncbi:MAG: hypothetical protein BGO49_24855 [Planctomycetales bacterium 71-10]|nr:MAG: hypothetical protein BGO49_24855 [Planctomycetales bacterium 71-10]
MWKLVYGSVQGTSHVASGKPCQDYCSGMSENGILVAACSDGAGSAELSHFGSRAAVLRFMEEASHLAGAPDREALDGWVASARESVLAEAEAQGVPPRQLACTFLAAIIGEDWAAFAQIGDGVIVFDGSAGDDETADPHAPPGYDLAFWPDNGEYANTTRFLTQADFRDHLRIEIVPRRICELAVMTDGLQMLALDVAGSRVHDRFFAPLFRTVKAGSDEETLTASLLGFMDSKRVNERTDDDKTLLLATRIIPDVPASLPDPAA